MGLEYRPTLGLNEWLNVGTYSSHMECVGMHSPITKTGFCEKKSKLPTKLQTSRQDSMQSLQPQYLEQVEQGADAEEIPLVVAPSRRNIVCQGDSEARLCRGKWVPYVVGMMGYNGIGPKNPRCFFGWGGNERCRPFFSQYIMKKVGSDNKSDYLELTHALKTNQGILESEYRREDRVKFLTATWKKTLFTC